VREATTDYRARTVVLGLIALLCVPVTMVGVAGALNFATGQRVREIAIELAIGAEPRDIRRRVIRSALSSAGLAMILGLGVGAATAAVLSAFLYGVSPIDRNAILASCALIAGVAWASALLPAHRAGRISPTAALRE
jgi:ABC-type antimicrobial peptide transport system permease subunit